MKTIVGSKEESVRRAADQIAALLAEKSEAVLALSAGRTMSPLFAELAARYEAGELSLGQARIFAVTELENVAADMSCRHQLETELVEKTDLELANCHFLTAEGLETYDEEIDAAGGIDLAVLGLGDNAHFGYNEPAVPFDSHSHRQKLTVATRRQNAERFGGLEQTPETALTMGIKTLVVARDIMVLAFGEEKAEAVHKMLYGRNDSAVPAAFLQIPLNVTVYLDEAAAAKL